MATKQLTDFYETKYAKDADSSIEIPSFTLVKHPRNRFEATIKMMHESFKGGRILEVGCGNGIVAKGLLDSGLEFDSYILSDLSKPRIEAVKKSLNDKRFETSVLDVESDDWPYDQDEKFDCILVVALIEHLIDPISVMKKLSNHLTADGFIYVMTPNVARWVKRIRLIGGYFPATSTKNEGLTTYEGGKVRLHDEGHLHYFTYRSLSLLLTEYCGYTRTEKVPYFEGTRMGPIWFESSAANAWPEMFAELGMKAYVSN